MEIPQADAELLIDAFGKTEKQEFYGLCAYSMLLAMNEIVGHYFDSVLRVAMAVSSNQRRSCVQIAKSKINGKVAEMTIREQMCKIAQ